MDALAELHELRMLIEKKTLLDIDMKFPETTLTVGGKKFLLVWQDDCWELDGERDRWVIAKTITEEL